MSTTEVTSYPTSIALPSPANPPTRVGPESNGMLMTPEEYDAIEEWDEFYRYELIHGVLIVLPPAGLVERSPNDELGYLLRLYRDTHPSGKVVDVTAPEQEIVIGPDRRRADRAIWVGLGRSAITLEDVPTIAVEFVSNTSRDRHRDYVVKRQEYSDAGVREYWIIDRFRRTMTVFRSAKEGGVEKEIVVAEKDEYETPLMPGFKLPLAKLLASADQFAESDS